MTSIGFGDMTPMTDVEKIISLIVMIIGASTYAGIFGAFVVIIDNIQAEEREKQQNIEEVRHWCQTRKLPSSYRKRMIHYF